MLVIYIAKAADWENQRRKEVSMKKSTVFVLFLLAAMLLGICVTGNGQQHKGCDYYDGSFHRLPVFQCF